MAIEVTELYQHRHGEMQGSTHGTRRDFHVKLPIAAMGDVFAISVDGVPALNDFHPQSATLWCHKKVCRPVNGEPKLFRVVCHYGIPDGAGGTDPNPTDRPATIRWSYRHVTEDVAVDLDGTPIVNTAEDLLEGVTRDATNPVLNITQNDPAGSFSAATANTLMNTVNSQAWYSAVPNEAKISEISAAFIEDVGGNYWQVSLGIYFKRETGNGTGWNPRILNAGMQEWVDTFDHAKGRRRIKNAKHPHAEVVRPVALNAFGQAIFPENGVSYVPDAHEAQTPPGRFILYNTGDFNSLLNIRWPPGS